MACTTRCMDMFFDSRPRTELEYLITFSQINTELYLESKDLDQKNSCVIGPLFKIIEIVRFPNTIGIRVSYFTRTMQGFQHQ